MLTAVQVAVSSAVPRSANAVLQGEQSEQNDGTDARADRLAVQFKYTSTLVGSGLQRSEARKNAAW